MARMEPGREGRPVAGAAHGREVGRQRVGGRSEPEEKYLMTLKEYFDAVTIRYLECATEVAMGGAGAWCRSEGGPPEGVAGADTDIINIIIITITIVIIIIT